MPTLRELYEAILLEEGVPVNKINAIATRFLSLGRAKDTAIVHQIGPNGFHRLLVDDKPSEWISPTEVIRNGDFIATTDAYTNILPQVGKVFSLKNERDFRTESVQKL